MRPNMFLIPEILILLGKHLDRHTLVSCLRVCLTWHAAFISMMWSDTTFAIPNQDQDQTTPHSLALQNHAIFVRKLQVLFANANTTVSNFSPKFSNLLVLKIKVDKLSSPPSGSLDKGTATSDFCKLLMTNSNDDDGSGSNPQGRCLENLRELEIRDFELKDSLEWMTLYEQLWSRLEVLSLVGEWWDSTVSECWSTEMLLMDELSHA